MNHKIDIPIDSEQMKSQNDQIIDNILWNDSIYKEIVKENKNSSFFKQNQSKIHPLIFKKKNPFTIENSENDF